jgi:hypothetical protein
VLCFFFFYSYYCVWVCVCVCVCVCACMCVYVCVYARSPKSSREMKFVKKRVHVWLANLAKYHHSLIHVYCYHHYTFFRSVSCVRVWMCACACMLKPLSHLNAPASVSMVSVDGKFFTPWISPCILCTTLLLILLQRWRLSYDSRVFRRSYAICNRWKIRQGVKGLRVFIMWITFNMFEFKISCLRSNEPCAPLNWTTAPKYE